MLEDNAILRMEKKSANLLEKNKHHSCLADKIPKIKLDPEIFLGDTPRPQMGLDDVAQSLREEN